MSRLATFVQVISSTGQAITANTSSGVCQWLRGFGQRRLSAERGRHGKGPLDVLCDDRICQA